MTIPIFTTLIYQNQPFSFAFVKILNSIILHRGSQFTHLKQDFILTGVNTSDVFYIDVKNHIILDNSNT